VGDIAAVWSSLFTDFRLCWGARMWCILLLCEDFI